MSGMTNKKKLVDITRKNRELALKVFEKGVNLYNKNTDFLEVYAVMALFYELGLTANDIYLECPLDEGAGFRDLRLQAGILGY